MNTQNTFEMGNKADVWPNMSSLVSASHCELSHKCDQYRFNTMIEETVTLGN